MLAQSQNELRKPPIKVRIKQSVGVEEWTNQLTLYNLTANKPGNQVRLSVCLRKFTHELRGLLILKKERHTSLYKKRRTRRIMQF